MRNGNRIIACFEHHDGRLRSATLGLINHLLIPLVSGDLKDPVLIQIDPNRSAIVILANFPTVGSAHLSMKDSIEEAQVVVVSVDANPRIPVITVIVEIQPSVTRTVGQSA